jgi:hypothetical protein
MNANTDSVSSKWIFEGIVKKLITIVSNASRLKEGVISMAEDSMAPPGMHCADSAARSFQSLNTESITVRPYGELPSR